MVLEAGEPPPQLSTETGTSPAKPSSSVVLPPRTQGPPRAAADVLAVDAGNPSKMEDRRWVEALGACVLRSAAVGRGASKHDHQGDQSAPQRFNGYLTKYVVARF